MGFTGSRAGFSRSGDEAVETVGGGCGDGSLGLGSFSCAFALAFTFPPPIFPSPLLLDGFSRSGKAVEAVEAVDGGCGDGAGWVDGSLGVVCLAFAFAPPVLPKPLPLGGFSGVFGGGGDGDSFSGSFCCLNLGGVS